MRTKKIGIALLGVCVLFLTGCASTSVNITRLSEQDRTMVIKILKKLDPIIAERRSQETIAALTFEELYAPLDNREHTFLHRFENIDPNHLNLALPYQGIPQTPPQLIAIKGQIMNTPAGPQEIPTQFLPKTVYDAYVSMSAAMEKDLGKTVYVESGYRSAAYQLYLFLFYLQNHDYSTRETARFVAWPGYSEHGWPEHQAIDLVNEKGIDGQNNPAEFETLEEYRWLLKNADRYGFELSYPKNSKMAFEPWHWRYVSAEKHN
jgi:LAS superfamily LD-carboxypeptidase LdcB